MKLPSAKVDPLQEEDERRDGQSGSRVEDHEEDDGAVVQGAHGDGAHTAEDADERVRRAISPQRQELDPKETVTESAAFLRAELLEDAVVLKEGREAFYIPPQESSMMPRDRELKGSFAPTVPLPGRTALHDVDEEECDIVLPPELLEAQGTLSLNSAVSAPLSSSDHRLTRLLKLLCINEARLRLLAGVLEDEAFAVKLYSPKAYLYVMGHYPRHNVPRRVVAELAAINVFSSSVWDNLFLATTSLWLLTITAASASASPSTYSPVVALEMIFSLGCLSVPILLAPVIQRGSSDAAWEEASLFLSSDWGFFFIDSLVAAGYRQFSRDLQCKEVELVIEELNRVNEFLQQAVKETTSYTQKTKLLSAVQRAARVLETLSVTRKALSERPSDGFPVHGAHLRSIAASFLFILLSWNLTLLGTFTVYPGSMESLPKPARQVLACPLILSGAAIALCQCVEVWRRLRKKLVPTAEMSIKWQALSRRKILLQRCFILCLLLTPSLTLLIQSSNLAIALGASRPTPAGTATGGLYVTLFLTAGILMLSRKGGMVATIAFLLTLSPLMGFIALIGQLVDGVEVAAWELCCVLLLQLAVLAAVKSKLAVLWRLNDL